MWKVESESITTLYTYRGQPQCAGRANEESQGDEAQHVSVIGDERCQRCPGRNAIRLANELQNELKENGGKNKGKGKG